MTVQVSTGASEKLRRREEMYRIYMEFFEHSERTRRWSPLKDIPWEQLDTPQMQQTIADGQGPASQQNLGVCLETFCGIELFVPDYTSNGLRMSREISGQTWFHVYWGYEEAKHALVFREYLLRSGLRTTQQYLDYEEKVLEKVWNLPFSSNREMMCYGALQEIATFLIYASQREKYRKSGNPVLATIFNLVARDEAAHASFYRKMMLYEFREDPQGLVQDLAHVIANFEMPGAQLLPDFQSRLEVEGVGISKQLFMERGIMPTLRHVGITRRDLVNARRGRTPEQTTAA